MKKNAKFYIILNVLLCVVIGSLFYMQYRKENQPKVKEDLLTVNLDTNENVTPFNPDQLDSNTDTHYYPIKVTNEDKENAKVLYLISKVTSDEQLLKAMDFKIKDGNSYLSFEPNNKIKKITVQPGESKEIIIRVYVNQNKIVNMDTLKNMKASVIIANDEEAFEKGITKQ
ncbi:MAG: hypothetical protein WBO70_02735 [Erysipelotrichaceae bacterium]